jgi:heptosyltransferase-1
MSYSPDLPGSAPDRILIVRLSAHGDVIQTLPLLSALKEAWPQASIGWLCEPSAAPLLVGHPLIDRLHIVQRPQWLRDISRPSQWPRLIRAIRTFLHELKTANYELSMDVQGLLKSAIWPYWVKIPNRMGFLATREGADRLYTWRLPPMDLRDGQTPAVERYLDFARALGASVQEPRFVLPEPSQDAQTKANALLLTDLSSNAPLLALAPFTRWPSKHWIPEHWQALLQLLLNRNYRLILLGGPGDQKASASLVSALTWEASSDGQLVNVTGQTDWPTMQALLGHCDALIGLDSAPLHLANALGKPVIALFGPTASGRTGPVGLDKRVLTAGVACQPCFQRQCPLPEKVCMTQLSPERVLAEVEAILNNPTKERLR